MAAAPLDRVKALLAALPTEDQKELRRYLGDILLTGDEAEAIQVASLEMGRGAKAVTYTYRNEWIRCGKPSCRCAEGAGHGPYTYKYWKEGGRLRKEYLGKGGATRRSGTRREAPVHDSSAVNSSGPKSPA